jgi:hypothetical protein
VSDRKQTPDTPEPVRVPTPAVESAPAGPEGGLALGQLGSVEAVLALQQASGNQAVDRVMRGQMGTGETTLPGALGAALVSGLGGWGGAGSGAGSGLGDSGAGGDDDAGGDSAAGTSGGGEGGATEAGFDAGDDEDDGMPGDAGAGAQDDGESFSLRPRAATPADHFDEPGPGIPGWLDTDGGADGHATRESWARRHAGEVPAQRRGAQPPVSPAGDAVERRRQVEALRDMTGADTPAEPSAAIPIAAIDGEDAARARNDAARAQLLAWHSQQNETSETPA